MPKEILINRFIPRDYQQPFVDAFENMTHKRYLLCWGRRSGKDVCAFNLMFREAMRTCGVYYYILPTFAQAKRVIWDSINNDGQRFLDYIPKEAIYGTNSQEQKITLVNGSIIQLIGSTSIDNIVGSNPRGAVYSEYALQSELAYQYLRPIFLANGGWSVFISTARGRNHFFDLYRVAKSNQTDWFFSFLTVEDTGHIPLEEINKEVEEGLMSYDMSRQEYWCDFSVGAPGAYYAKHIDKMRLEERITYVPYDSSLPTHTAFDLGINDPTVIIFFQITSGNAINIIDFYEKAGVSLEEHIKYVKEMPFTYGIHIGPHDIKQRELSTGMTRWEKAYSLGVVFKIAPSIAEGVRIEDGIEAVRTVFSRMRIDQVRCKELIRHLENYRQEYDDKKKTYKLKPVHDTHSHAADAMRYLASSLHMLQTGMTQDDINKARARARGGSPTLPKAFRDIRNQR